MRPELALRWLNRDSSGVLRSVNQGFPSRNARSANFVRNCMGFSVEELNMLRSSDTEPNEATDSENLAIKLTNLTRLLASRNRDGIFDQRYRAPAEDP